MKRLISWIVLIAFVGSIITACGPEPESVTYTKTLADGSTVTSVYTGDDAEEFLADLEEETLDPVYDNDEDFYEAKLAENPDYYEYGNEGYGYAPQGYQPHYPQQYNSHLSDIVMGVMIGSMLSGGGGRDYRSAHRTTINKTTVVNNNAKKERNKRRKKGERVTAPAKKQSKKAVTKKPAKPAKKPVVKPKPKPRPKPRKSKPRRKSKRR